MSDAQPTVGGQALPAGVLVRTPLRWAVAIRGPGGGIHTEAHDVRDRWTWMRGTFLRGLAALAEAVSIGIAALKVSVRVTAGVEPTSGQISSTLGLAGAGVVALFMLAPGVFASGESDVVADILEALVRALILLAYLFMISRSGGVRQLVGYHGAEHKVIAAFEASGGAPTIGQARAASPIHSRCGTSFLAFLVIAAGVVHAFLPRHPVWAAALWRLVVLPADVALAYELMRASARTGRSIVARVISVPGRVLQRLTTAEPSDDQLEVAMAAFTAVYSAR